MPVTSLRSREILSERSFRTFDLGLSASRPGSRRNESCVIEIEAFEEGEFWKFSVRDDGIGFDESFADRIFMLFQRLHTREEYEGTGIGLALCKKIVSNHGGEIWAESQIGEGTTFYFTLPGNREAEEPKPEVSPV